MEIEVATGEQFGVHLNPRYSNWTFDGTSPIRRTVANRYSDDPVKQGEFLKHLRATREDMTTFDLLTLDARDWCVAFLKTEGKWKEG